MSERDWEAGFDAATADFDWPTVKQLAIDYAAHLYAVPTPPDSVKHVLQTLRQALRYEDLEVVSDAALAHGIDVYTVRRQYAQALVDGGNPTVALRLYNELAADQSVPPNDRIEARGGIGRCYKELFLACTEPARRKDYLTRSLKAYLEAYEEDTTRIWHGINAVALLARAERTGTEPPVGSPQVADLAAAILHTVENRDPSEPDELEAWTQVTACEALIALGRFDDAIKQTFSFIEGNPDGFIIAAYYRQLRTVWQLDTTASPGDKLLPVLRSALLKIDGGQVTVESADVRAARMVELGGRQLEKVLGTDRYQSLTWYRNGLLRCRAVARIQNGNDDGIGTGFLVAGPDLHPDLPPLVVITNGHVVPEGLDPDDAVVVFHGLDDDPGQQSRFEVARVWWYQPSAGNGLDTTILELDGYPANVIPVPLAKALPRKPLNSGRAYVIGHPRGLAQPQFSLQDNLLLDYDERVLRYRSPTEGGSSGSPVFNNEWKLIGLHHAGGTTMPALNNEGGTYPANEGITLAAIRRGLTDHPPGA